MSGHVERLEAFTDAWQSAMDDDLTSDVIAVIDGKPLRESDLRALLDEVKQLRAERLGDTHAAAKVIAATNRHARGDSLTQLHQAIDALEQQFDDRWELLEDDAAPQQPARDGEAPDA